MMSPKMIKAVLGLVCVAAGAFGYDVAFSDRAVEVISLVVSAFSAGAAFVTIKEKAKDGAP